MKTSHIKILAPAGDFSSLNAAINAGADEVYFGIGDFNMRATAARNFTLENLEEVVKLCHDNNIKANVTVNTLLYNNEMEKMKRVVDAVKKAGGDAIIAADMATILYAREQDMEVNISTQMSISNTEGVKFYSQFADRVILARELSLEQVKQICDDIKEQDIRGPRGELVEIEVFAHGALCVAVSGRCAMSLYCSGTSANRGKCSHICRRRYKVIDVDNGQELEIDNNYIMSSSDLCTIGLLPELVASGVTVLKFEGRGRPAEYVDTVISTYKEALESIENETYNQEKVEQWTEKLETVFNRGLYEGMYMGRSGKEWAGVHGSKATEEKVHIGHVQHYYPKVGVAEVIIKAKNEIEEGEKYGIIGETTGIVKGELKGMWLDEEEIKTAKQGDVITFKVPSRVRENDRFYVFRKRESLIPRGKEKFFNT